MIRLFVALRPPPAIRDALGDLMDGVPGARWQSDEQLHLTLRFIGEVDRHQGEDVAAALAAIHAPVPRVALAGVGRFGRGGRTDTLWAGLVPAAPLAHFAAKVEQACQRAGLPPETRAYLPHITVARLPRSLGGAPEVDRWCRDHAGLVSPPFDLPHLILYQSYPGHEGAMYEPVMRWALEPAPGPERLTRD